MRLPCAFLVFCLSGIVCSAQTAGADQALLTQARAKYDAPFNRNLQSFDCVVGFSWKQHFSETTRVGDEGSDEELDSIFQPIQNRVTVTPDKVTPSAAGLTDDAIQKLPHGGMAEFLLEHAVQKSLETWLPASLGMILPAPGSPVSFVQSPLGYQLAYKMQDADVEMALGTDLRLAGATLKGPQTEHFDTSFAPGPQGFVLTSLTMGEDGNSTPGNRLIFTYTYQTVDGVQIPERLVVNRESHHEVWRFTLSGCAVKKSN